MHALTKANLAAYIEEAVGLEASLAKVLVTHFFDEIAAMLEKNEKIKLSGLGSFSVRQKSSRPGRNPKTGEAVMIKPRKVVSFQTSVTLRKLLNSLS